MALQAIIEKSCEVLYEYHTGQSLYYMNIAESKIFDQ
jgi:hypothetical protein